MPYYYYLFPATPYKLELKQPKNLTCVPIHPYLRGDLEHHEKKSFLIEKLTKTLFFYSKLLDHPKTQVLGPNL